MQNNGNGAGGARNWRAVPNPGGPPRRQQPNRPNPPGQNRGIVEQSMKFAYQILDTY